MVGAPCVLALVWVLPLDLEPGAHRLAGIFAAILVLWLSEAIPIAATALMIAPLLVVFEVTDAKEAFKHYADPLLYLFVGGFFIAEAMSAHGLDRRIAKAIVAAPGVAGVPSRVRIALMAAGALLSMWISNTASTAILVPILLKMIGPAKGDDRAGTGGLLALAYACSIGGLGTLVGSPPNLITLRILNVGETQLGFLDWMSVGMPTALILCALIYVVTRRMYPPQVGAGADTRALFEDVPVTWRRGEIATAVAFGLAVVGWILPGVTQALDLEIAPALKSHLHPGVVAILAASLLFFVPTEDGERALTWRRAKQIDWGIILLFGGGIALGTQLVDTGLAAAISRGFVGLTGIASLWPLVAVCCVFTIFFTEVCSNTASANMLVPLVVAIADQLEVSPIPPALAVGLAASCAFMLPIATGPNAIAYSTGRVPQGEMIRVGLVLNLTGAVVVFLVLRVLCPLYGWV